MRNSIVGKILMALIFASLIGGISVGPALGQDYRRQAPQQRGYYDHRGYYDNRGRPVYRPRGYYHPGPRYGPPIYTVPVPSPGISLFFPFPFDIR
jgi:hypothetical protein